MALSRRSGARFNTSIWPGFVDAMTALLLVLMFVLSIFMIMQFILQETITGQESELDTLNAEVSALASALGLARERADGLETEVGDLNAQLAQSQADGIAQAALISRLQGQLEESGAALTAAQGTIADFEEQVAALILARNAATARAEGLATSLGAAEEEAARLARDLTATEEARLAAEQEVDALTQRLTSARSEIDAQAETARLAAARREARRSGGGEN